MKTCSKCNRKHYAKGLCKRHYEQSPKRKECKKEYQQSPKYKEYQKKYQQSPKYKEYKKEYQKKYYQSKKNFKRINEYFTRQKIRNERAQLRMELRE